MNIIITTIIENTCFRHGLLAQHGQSLLIDFDGHKYLFDTGEIYEGLIYNLKALKIKISEIEGIIISHRHGDHCGALADLLPLLDNQKIYFPKDINSNNQYDHVNQQLIKDHDLTQKRFNKIENYPNTILIVNSIQLQSGLFLTNLIGNDIKELSIVADLKDKGLVLIVGCFHPGLPDIIKDAKKITGNQKIYGIIGGFHYKDLIMDQLDGVIDTLRKENLSFVVPSHCTGSEAIHYLKQKLGDIVKVSNTGSLGVGNSIQISPPLEFDFSKH